MNYLILSILGFLTGFQVNTNVDTIEVANIKYNSFYINIQSATVATGDFNDDGHIDLVGTEESQLTFFCGNGRGELTSQGNIYGGENPVDFALADLNEDESIDIAIANHDTDYITLLLGNGDGTFQPAPNSPLHIKVQPHPHAIRAVDLDNDGHIDLVVDHREAESILVLRGRGNGQFETPGVVVSVSGDPYRGMALGDINNDGKLDLVTPNPREVGVLLNVSSEQLQFTQLPPILADAPFAVELGDFNDDNLLDVITASDEGSELIELFFGNGQGGFNESSYSPLRLAPGGKKIVVTDFNGDNIDDAAVSSYQSSNVILLFGGLNSNNIGYLPGGENPWGLAAADFNEDGKSDLIIANDNAQQAIMYMSIE